MKPKKPRAYLNKYRTGWFLFEPIYGWIAKDCWGNRVAYGRTRKECEKECRYAGYVPIRE